MEQRLGYDFSRVRVHLDAAAEQSARGVAAEAYTVGNDIVFGPGRFAPRTLDGRRLIAHELTHVVQQSGPRSIRSPLLQRQALTRTESPTQGSQASASTVIRPRIKDKAGHTFREKATHEGQVVPWVSSGEQDPVGWAEEFLQWCGFDWVQDPTGEVGRIKYVLRHIDDKFYTAVGIRDTRRGSRRGRTDCARHRRGGRRRDFAPSHPDQ